MRDALVDGFSNGFRIPSYINRSAVSTSGYANHSSACVHSNFVNTKLNHELALGRVAGPFASPTPPDLIISPLGVVPKKTPGEYRLIHDLSFPKDNSVNSHIPKIFTEVQYELLDDCISIICSLGPNCLIAKADIKDAFRIIPIHPNDYGLLGFTWQNTFYHDRCLPMGASTSCQTFESFSTALQWILTSALGVRNMSHILDDFIFFGPSNSPQCHTSLQAFLILAKSLSIPLRPDNTVHPTNLVSLHGIEVDTTQMQMRLPPDKLLDARAKIDSVYRPKKVSLRQLQSLIGTLSFACKVIVPGRVFLRRVTDLTCGVHNQEHMIRLNVEARLDLSTWRIFLDSFNGMSMFLSNEWVSSDAVRLFSDASALGFAAIYGTHWFQGRFPPSWSHTNIAVKELLPIVLAVQLWGPLMANSRMLCMCDNMSIVAVINSRTSKDRSIMDLLRKLAIATMSHNVHFAAKHIPGKFNSAADALSRFQDGVARRSWLSTTADHILPEMLPW